MKNFLEAPYLIEMVRTTTNMYAHGWDERNGGNISLLLDEEQVADYVDTSAVIRTIPTGFKAPELDGKLFLVTGTGQYLKEHNPQVQIVALEPEDSPVLSEGRAGAHKIQGIGAGFVPDVLDTQIYDEIFKASNQDAFATARLLAKKEGISVGISSGAALFGAIQLAQRPENKGKTIVALLPDSGDRYYSTPIFTEA